MPYLIPYCKFDSTFSQFLLRRKTMSIEVGQKAPIFTLPTDEGEMLSLDDLKGKKVILYFYPKDDTPGCTKEACGFRDVWSQLSKAGVVVLGISKDSVKAHQSFKQKYNLPFTLLSDKDNTVCEQYGVMVDKNRFGKKYKGIERTTFLIDEEGVISAVWPKVKVDGHVAEVVGRL
ncbi:thioredoxin-dependent thiol peroxidase [Coxiella burnetii]|nr:thioredoxin-dependent thiol peroxidase [Coxiella burnetii]NP_819971.2 thioredoxin peroxidase [Coxiella burnetii RSA 493]AAO90485.2 thioredoxin peroxidase [Coxiella burnetii RSA 493]ARI65789.1 peroxiredoxin [Coxiella burnetii]AZV75866.1 thioredoxin-dependent thiol peroxidase [Coxiella burnetii]MCF2092815.1 thioredoxin-dependent thiol peroxidase [Coxiella burnetii]MCF2094989.1 thioredoxin-dependent thiol peroxidase [Coxiella burnetii]